MGIGVGIEVPRRSRPCGGGTISGPAAGSATHTSGWGAAARGTGTGSFATGVGTSAKGRMWTGTGRREAACEGGAARRGRWASHGDRIRRGNVTYGIAHSVHWTTFVIGFTGIGGTDGLRKRPEVVARFTVPVHDPSLGPVGSVSHVAVLHTNPDKQHVRPRDVPSVAVY